MSVNAAEILKKCDPVTYYEQFLFENVFPDGRATDKYRSIGISPGVNWKSQRSVLVEHGDVVVSINGRLILQRDNDGPSLKFKFKTNERKANTPPGTIMDILKYLAKENVFFDRDELKTEETEFRWQLKITISIFSAEGFIMDAVLIGLNALFLQITIPEIKYNWLTNLERSEQKIDVKRIQIFNDRTRNLQIKETPVFSAFTMYLSQNSSASSSDKAMLLVDPPSDLIPLCASTFEFIAISGERILHSKIHGHVELSDELFDETAQLAIAHYNEVHDALARFKKQLKSSS